jgi:hypothetical protein
MGKDVIDILNSAGPGKVNVYGVDFNYTPPPQKVGPQVLDTPIQFGESTTDTPKKGGFNTFNPFEKPTVQSGNTRADEIAKNIFGGDADGGTTETPVHSTGETPKPGGTGGGAGRTVPSDSVTSAAGSPTGAQNTNNANTNNP